MLRLQDYLAEVTKIKLLDPVTEQELWFKYKQEQDLDSRQRLIEQYQPLVVKALTKWRGSDTQMMDMVQEGIVGLIEAVEKFDPSRGVAFSLYAIHRIRGRMLNYLEKESKTARVSVSTSWGSEEGIAFAETIADNSPSVSDTAEMNYLLDQMHSAMDRLPNKERMVLSGVFIQEQDPGQVASTLAITQSHLYRLQKQGIRRVRGMLSRLMSEIKK